MIDFYRSTFTWQSHPWVADDYYRYPGGFVGDPGDVYHVRFRLEAACTVADAQSGHVTQLYVGAPCRTEYTIAERNLFQVPSGEFRFAFSEERSLPIATLPSTVEEEKSPSILAESFRSHDVSVRRFAQWEELPTGDAVGAATLDNRVLNARSRYHEMGLTVEIEFPVNLINIDRKHDIFQICTGPIILPDAATWDGRDLGRVFLAHVAFTTFDHVEFILRREVDASPKDRAWLNQPRGRDRLELIDPARRPPDAPPSRPRPTVYNEVWEREAINQVLAAVDA